MSNRVTAPGLIRESTVAATQHPSAPSAAAR